MDQAGGAAPTVQDALAVISTFNSTTNEVEREHANRWLAAFQKSIFAWTISDEILRLGSDLNACFFAAQTMRTKIQYSFHELPPETHVSLKNSLLEHAGHLTAHSPAAITSQLCVAITHTYFKMTAWTGEAVSELFTRFGNDKQHWYVLVELLQTIAEELNSRHLSVTTARRDELIGDLSRYSRTVIEFLTACLNELNTLAGCSNAPSEFARLNATNVDIATRMRIRVFLCLGSSVAAHILNEVDLLESSCLFETGCSFLTTFGESDDSLLHDAITECLCSTMIACEDLTRYGRLAERLHRYVLALEEAYMRAVALQQLDAACNVCRIWTETAETFFEHFFVASPNAFGDMRLLEQLLVCVGHSSYELAEITLPFWFNMLEQLRRLAVRVNRGDEQAQNGSSSPDAHAKEDRQQTVAVIQRFEPVLRRLLVSIVRRCEFEDTADGTEEESELEEFRRRAADLVQDVTAVLGTLASASLIGDLLADAHRNGSAPFANDSRWQLVEAGLFAVRFVIVCAESDTAGSFELVASLLDYALAVPVADEHTPLALRRTSVMLIGELARFIGTRTAQRDSDAAAEDARSSTLLERALALLFTALRDARLGVPAARALAQVCSECRAALVAHIGMLLDIVAQCDAFALRHDASIELTKCVALTLAELPARTATRTEQIVTVLRHVMRAELDKVLRCIAAASRANGSVHELASSIDRDRQRPDDPCVHLDRMGILFRYLTFSTGSDAAAGDSQHPIVTVALEIWPDFVRTLEHFKASNRVSERCCRCIRFMLRSAHHSMIVLLDEIISRVTSLYVETGHTCFLYLASVVVDEFGADESLQSKLIEMTMRLAMPTVHLFTSNPASMVSQPDAVEDFFRLATRSFQRMQRAFVESEPLVTSTLLCAVPAIRIQHKDAHFAVNRFLSEFIDALESLQRGGAAAVPPYCAIMNEKIMTIGAQLVNNVLLACLFDLPSHMVVDAAELLYTILFYNEKAFSEWLEVALKQLAESASLALTFRVTDDDLRTFHRDVIAAKTSKQVTSRVKQFSRLFRR